MYNGIGLLTPRGSGTSGYVTSNKFNLRRAPPPKDEVRKESDAPKQKKPNEEILLHNKKREIEVKLCELRMKLEDEDQLDEKQIEEMVAMERSVLEKKLSRQEEAKANEVNNASQETHEVARRKMAQMERLRNALGISRDVKEGEAFNFELQEERKKETKEKREAMDRERRRRGKEEKQRREDMESSVKHKAREESHKSREKRKSRERSPERELIPSREKTEQQYNGRRDQPHDTIQREDRWLPDEGPKYDKTQTNEADPEGGMNFNHRSYERQGQPYHQASYHHHPPPYRYNDPPFRGRFYQRRPYNRGRGGRFFGRASGYYRKGEVAPERYNPMDHPSDIPDNRRQGDWERQERWQKMNDVNMDASRDARRDVPYGEYDAHANIQSGRPARVHTMRPRQCREDVNSPGPRSPSSMRQSPSNPRFYRRPLHHRSGSPSPYSLQPSAEPDAGRSPVPVDRKVSSRSPREQKAPSPEKDVGKKSRRKDRGGSFSSGRTTSERSRRGSSARRSSYSSSSRSRSNSRRSPARRNRSLDRPSSRRRPTEGPWHEHRGRFGGYHNRGRYSEGYRRPNYNRGYAGGRYNGGRRGPSYGYNWRHDRQRQRQSSRSRSREHRRRKDSRSYTPSCSPIPPGKQQEVSKKS